MKKAARPIITSSADSRTLSSWKGLDAIAIGIKETDSGPVALESLVSNSLVAKLDIDFALELSEWPSFTAKAGEIIELPISEIDGIKRVYFVGVGSQSLEDLRKAGAQIGRKTKGTGFTVLDGIATSKEHVTAHAMAISLSQYEWKLTSKQEPKLGKFIFLDTFTSQINRANLLIEAIYSARDLIHTPSNIKTPAWMVSQTKLLAKHSDLSIKVLAGKDLQEFGGLLAVGNSSPNPGPRFIEVSYAPKGSKSWPHVVLVGKGITYDTGGVSLKRPGEIMVPMKSDMAGAAAVLGVVSAMPEIKPKARVTALLMCAENALSSTAQRPSDVITQYGGTTVEIRNTDAEGRLVLADGLAYADINLNPDFLIDVATLTGAATQGLGRQYAAMYTRNSALAKDFQTHGEKTGERVWQMPLIDDYKIALESPIADFSHTADRPKFSAGSVTAALFLEHFAGKRNWVHFDIAGPARSDSDSGENPKGGTGFGVRLLIDWIAGLE